MLGVITTRSSRTTRVTKFNLKCNLLLADVIFSFQFSGTRNPYLTGNLKGRVKNSVSSCEQKIIPPIL
jgi:hypothetical protein